MVRLCKIIIWWKCKSLFIVHVKPDDIYKEIAEDVETRSDTSNYELDRPLLKKNVIGFKNKIDINSIKKKSHKEFIKKQ